MVVQMDFSGKTLLPLSILGERNAIFPAPKLFCGRQYNQVPLSPILIVGRREGRFRSMRFNVEAMSIRAVADCGEVQPALSERSFSDFWPPQLGEKRFRRQNHVPQHRLRP